MEETRRNEDAKKNGVELICIMLGAQYLCFRSIGNIYVYFFFLFKNQSSIDQENFH